MKENFEFSIIVPVYNVEKYIEECIESIISQTYKDFELILVDDGSNDKSSDICDEYAKKNMNIKVIHKKNGGLSSARNAGINASSGRYLMFIDGDDKLRDINNLELLNKIAKKENVDILFYKMIYWYGEKYKYNNKQYDNSFSDKVEIINSLNEKGLLSVSACDKVVKRDLVVDNDLYFQENLLSEDIHWSFKLYLYATSFYHTNLNIYMYRQQRKDSISTTKSEKSLGDLYYIIKFWMNYKYESEELKQVYFGIISYWYLIMRTNYPKKIYKRNMMQTFKKLDKEMLNYNKNYKVRLAYNISRIIGVEASFKIMRIYIKLKNKGLIRI